MPTIPPEVSTSMTRMLRASPKAWPLSQGVCGHGTRSMVVRMALMVMSLMGAFPLNPDWMLRKPSRGVNGIDQSRGLSCAAYRDRFYCGIFHGRRPIRDRPGAANAEDPSELAKTPSAERSFFPGDDGRRARPSGLHLRHDRAPRRRHHRRRRRYRSADAAG